MPRYLNIEESVNLLREKDGQYIVIKNDIEELENISKFGIILDNSDASIEIMPPSVMFHFLNKHPKHDRKHTIL